MGSQAASLTSVMLAQLYSSSFNDDKKLLAFSDSVQDAAHRAGFFAARTYRFNLRSAIQQCVQNGASGLSLAELPEAFIRHWLERLDEKAYIATFLPPDMSWFQDYEHLMQHGTLPEGSRLRSNVDRRIGWEIASEYGFQSRIGRTLEKSGSSIAHVDGEVLETTAERLLEVLQNEMGELRALDLDTLRRFLLGLLVHLKNQGAVFHPALESFIEDFGNRFLINRIHWMPSFGETRRIPAFLTTKSGTRFDVLISGTAGRRTWYQVWAEKCFFPVHSMIRSLTDRLYDFVPKVLVQGGVLEERKVRNDRIWGIRPEVIRVGHEVNQFRCNKCGHGASGALQDAGIWDGMLCLRFGCSGHYVREDGGLDYYGRIPGLIA